MSRVDTATGIFIMVFSVIIYNMAGAMPQVRLGIGPGDYPRVVAGGLLILGALLTVQSLRNKLPQTEMLYPPRALVRVFGLAIITYIYISLLGYLGFVYLTPFFLGIVMYLFGLRKWSTLGLVSILVTASIHYVFYSIFSIILPRFSLF